MDKRNLLFVFAVSLAFIGAQLFFRYQDSQRKAEWVAQQERIAERKNQELAVDLEHRIPAKRALPLVEAYENAEGSSLFGSGIQLQGGGVLVLSAQNLPRTLYVRPLDSNGSSEQLTQLSLARHAVDGAKIALYSKDPKAVLEVATTRDLADSDLYFIAFPPAAQPQEGVQVTLGTFKEGKLAFPGKPLKRLIPTDNALVLVKKAQGYLPVAYYDHAKQTLALLEDFQALGPFTDKRQEQVAKKPYEARDERFYVLENAYQQLVFSSRGAALVEINLPYRTAENHSSVVKEVGIDRDMVQKDPVNAHFPMRPFYTPSKDGKGPFQLHTDTPLGGYYPLLRRDLLSMQHKMLSQVPARYYALNLVSEYPETAELSFDVEAFDANHIVFSTSHLDKKITKTFRLPDANIDAPYTFDLEIAIEGTPQNLWLTSGVPDVEIISGSESPTLKYRITRGNASKVELIELPKETARVGSFHPDWVSNSNGFFGIILDPQTEIGAGFEAIRVPAKELPSRLMALDPRGERWNASEFSGYELLLPLKKKAGVQQFRIFAGPLAESVLNAVDAAYADPAQNKNPDYIASQTFHGWFAFISEPFARFLFMLMKGFYWLTHSWGLSIILLTVALRIMLYPLNAWSARSMAAMQAVAPEVAAIQAKHPNNPKAVQLETVALYRERGVNPLSGCLPTIMQIPFLIGMFDLLKSTFELRGACFIPGWIDDLAAPDVLFSWNRPIFFIGNELHLLPILLGLVMFAQQWLTASSSSLPVTDQQRQQRAMGNIMAVVFAAMFYQFPSGLNIYWLSSMLLGMVQQIYTNRTYRLPVDTKKKKKDQVVEVQGKRIS